MQPAPPGPRAGLRALAAPFLEALFPLRCPLCGAADEGAGLGCAEHEPRLFRPPSACGRCSRALPAVLPDGQLCPECRRDPPAFERLVALGAYAGDPGLREWLLAFKHGGRRDLAEQLGALLAARWRDAAGPGEGALLVPVPLHARRRFERGYDQARLLAGVVSEHSGVPCAALLARTRPTAPQGSPLAPARADNVRGAFRLRWRAERRCAGRALWLVDDVCTSGATLQACAELLREAGAGFVGALVLARAESARRGGDSA